ncbi:MAG: hypothetical protein ACI4IL_06415 [Eubacterium sp.]
MKKSFKKSIAVLLSVLMMVCVMPFSAFAADSKPDVNLQFNAFSLTGSGKTFQSTGTWVYNAANLKKFGIYSAPLDYDKNAGTLTLSAAKAQTTSTAKSWSMTATEDYTYGVGDYFTVTVRLDNISKLAAAQVALQYSDNIEPAGLYQKATSAFDFYSISDNKTEGSYNDKMDTARAGYPIPTQSAKGLYSGLNDGLVGDASYIDSDNRIIHTYVSNQDANSSTSVASISDSALTNADGSVGNTYANQAVLATYAFKIIGTGAITFSMADASSVDDCYYIADENDGTDPENYITYAQTDNAGSTGITFMGKNEFVAGTTYSITFKNADGSVISQADYDEGASIVVPDLPTKEADADYHYSYAWDTTPAATATDNAVYTAVETATQHTMSEEIIKDATTTETGEKKLTCDICGYTTTEIIPIKTCNHANTTTSEVVTKEATCKEEGSKTVTVTCSDCGTVVSTEVVAIPTTDHKWGEWVYNEDATNSANGTETRTCSVCGETETQAVADTKDLRIRSINLSLGSAIVVNCKINTTTVNAFDEVYAIVGKENKMDGSIVETRIDDMDIVDGTRKVFEFTNIAPQNMKDALTITFYGVRNGRTYHGTSYVYGGIATYAYSQLKNVTSKTPFAQMLVDMLHYGAAAQVYQNYNTEDLANAELTETQLGYGSGVTAPSYTQTQNTSYRVPDTVQYRWRSVGLKLDSAVRFNMRFSAATGLADMTEADLANIQIKVETSEGSVYYVNATEEPECFEPYSGGYTQCYFVFNKIPVSKLRNTVYFTVCDMDGNEISNTLAYTAETYCSKQSSGLRTLLDAMMVYADSCANYVASL